MQSGLDPGGLAPVWPIPTTLAIFSHTPGERTSEQPSRAICVDISYQTFVSHLAPSPPSLQPHTRLREEPTTFPLAWGKPCVTTPSPSWAQLTCRGMTEVPHYGKAGASSPRPSFLEVLMVQPLWPQEGNGQQCRHEHSRALGWHTQGAHKARPPSQDPGGAVRSSAPLFLTYHCPLAVWAQP